MVVQKLIEEAKEHATHDIPESTQMLLLILAEYLGTLVPKKPKKIGDSGYYECPGKGCNKFVKKREQSHGNIDIPHCKWCGQALDWSE